jgi:glycosyltransferase involved in cell wall biosynthesis
MKISVIICTFNSMGRLPKTLDSILAQKNEDCEVVLIDGASTDGTLEVIKEYEEKFIGRLKWISEKDTGIYNAMNKGVQMASGEFLNVIGAGDWLEKDALAQAVKCIEENPETDAVFGKTRIWNGDLKTNHVVQTGPEKLPVHPMQHPSLFYKKALHDKFGLYDESYRIAADYVFCLKAFYKGGSKSVPFDAVVANFVMDGMSSINQIKALKENKRALKEMGLRHRGFLIECLTYYKKKLFG